MYKYQVQGYDYKKTAMLCLVNEHKEWKGTEHPMPRAPQQQIRKGPAHCLLIATKSSELGIKKLFSSNKIPRLHFPSSQRHFNLHSFLLFLRRLCNALSH
jgi:hypothetical protein